jgi:hypothetical protein
VLLGADFSDIKAKIGQFGGQPYAAAHERSLYPFALSLREEAAVISRMLSEFQRRGLISTTRGGVQILDRPKLAAIAADH